MMTPPDNEYDAIFAEAATPEHQRADARQKIQNTVEALKDYILEASIRNIDVAEPLQIAFRRSKAIRGRSSDKFKRFAAKEVSKE